MPLTRRLFGLSGLSLGLGLANSQAATARTRPDESVKRVVERPAVQASDIEATTVAGIAGARFMADDPSSFLAALGSDPVLGAQPWLALSGGGENGAYGAGLLAGWSAAGTRPNFSVVTGISAGALIAPFAFAGPKWDEGLKAAFSAVTAADIFEFGGTPEGLLDTWPLARLIAKQVTPELLAEMAARHRQGRRLFVITTSVDTGRPVCWNIGAIAASESPNAKGLIQDVLLASSSIPGIFPPVHIKRAEGGRTFSEMHADGAITTPFYVAPEAMIASGSGQILPARTVYVVVNGQLTPDFSVTPRMTLAILGRAMSAAVKAGTRAALLAHAGFAARTGIDLKATSVGATFSETASGPFDGRYMKALFAHGVALGLADTAFDQPAGGKIAMAAR